MEGWANPDLWLFLVSVAPAMAEYSPPDNEVGMLITGILHGARFFGATSGANFARSSSVETPLASA
jgi:threonine/homoserine/homoserine lactone efflux protein